MDSAQRTTTMGVILFLITMLLAALSISVRGTSDIVVWRYWADNMQRRGIVTGYNSNEVLIDQPPLGILMLSAMPRALEPLGVPAYCWEEPAISGFKVSTFFFLVLTSSLVAAMTRSMLLAALTQLALLLNVALGYFDIYFVPTLILSLWALRTQRLAIALLLLTITCLIKWQPTLFLPFVLVYAWGVSGRPEHPASQRSHFLIHVLFPVCAVSIPFLFIYGPGMVRALHLAATHRFLSGNALNFNWLLTYFLHVFRPDKFGPLTDGACEAIKVTESRIVLGPKLLFWVAYAIALLALLRQKKTFRNFLVCSIAGYMAYFTFNTGVHENHLFPLLPLAILSAWEDTSSRWVAYALAVAANLNLFIFYGVIGEAAPFPRVIVFDLTLPLAVLNALLCTILLARAFKTPRKAPVDTARRIEEAKHVYKPEV